jgi:hypothetical protein
MNKLINGQLAYGKQIKSINDSFAPTGHAARGQHPRGLAIDLSATSPAERAGLVRAMTQAGFTGTGTYSNALTNVVHVDARTPKTGPVFGSGPLKGHMTWGPDTHAKSTPGWHKDAVAAGLANPTNWGNIVSGMRGGLPSPSASLPAAASQKVDPRGLMANAPRPKPAEVAIHGLNVARNPFDAQRGVVRQSNMNMAGYSSPMAGLTGMPQAPSRMNMAGYQSPVTGLGGMPSAPGRMDMAGYNSPMAAAPGLPTGDYDPLGSMRAPQAPAAARDDYDPLSSMAPPRAPERPAPPSPMAGQGMVDPQMAQSFAKYGRWHTAPRAPQPPNMDMAGYRSPMTGLTGMPPSPGQMNMAGYQSPMAAATGGLPVAQSGNRPRALGLENYQGPRPQEPAISSQQPQEDNQFAGLAGIVNKEPMDIRPPGPPSYIAGPQQPDSLMGRIMDSVYSQPGLAPDRSDMAGGEGGQAQWTGREPPQVVADMQQRVEQILRAYFFSAPQTEFPQYTTPGLPTGSMA